MERPMRVAMIVVTILAATTPLEAAQSCMSKTEARQHFGAVHIYWHGLDHCWDATPGRHQIRRVQRRTPTDEAQAKPDQPKREESKLDQPKLDQSKLDQSKLDQPKLDQSRSDQSRFDQSKWRDSMSEMLPDSDLAQALKARRDAPRDENDNAATAAPSTNRLVDIESSPLVSRWVDIAQVVPPPIIERRSEPLVAPRSAVLMLVAFVLIIGTVAIAFCVMVYDRPRSTNI